MQGGANAVDDSAADEALARRVITGDLAAEQELCRRLLPRVRAWGLKHLRNDAAARDLAQHVLLVVLQALRERRVTQVERLGPFVLGVCKNTMSAWSRGERRRNALLERFGASFADEALIDEIAPDRRRLATCFDRLAARPRTVLALTFFGEVKDDEIARELTLSSENVRVVRHRALRQLLACMTEAP